MKWFGRKAGVQPRPFLLRLWQGPTAAGEWPRSYEAQVREAYLGNPVAQRAVRLVAESVAWAPVYADQSGAFIPKEGNGRASTDPDRTASLISPQLLETTGGQLLLHGNAFVQLLLNAEGEPAELYPLRPERVSVEADRAGWPVAYVYKAGEAKSRIAARDELGRTSVVHLKAMHPLDDHYGLGCLGAAAGAVAIHNAATKWNKALLDNAARPSGALTFEPADGAALEEGEAAVEAFEDVRFPVALGREAVVEPAFSTAVVTTASGAEQRNSDWADARMRFDAGPGVRGEAELQALIAFFRARRGAAVGFRFEDPYDNSSSGMTAEPDPADQPIGVGDGLRTEFELVKHYEGQMRRITRPVAGSVRVSVDGTEQLTGWTLAAKGLVRFEVAPAAGAEVRAGFRFDVPVRFGEDRLSVSRATFAAGEASSVPLVETREG